MKFPQIPVKNAVLSQLHWMTGKWQDTSTNGYVEEHWSEMKSNSMMGMFRWIQKEEIFIYELMMFSVENSEIHLKIRHFDKNFIGWEEKDNPRDFAVVDLSPTHIVLMNTENPENGWMRYSFEKGEMRETGETGKMGETGENKDSLIFQDYDLEGMKKFELTFHKF